MELFPSFRKQVACMVELLRCVFFQPDRVCFENEKSLRMAMVRRPEVQTWSTVSYTVDF